MRYRILVVDDDSLVLSSTRLLLEQKGYEVETASSGEAALKLLKANPESYSLVLLDYQMKSKNGAETAKECLTVCRNIYVLIHSGDMSREAMKRTWEAGAVSFIEKGCSCQELLETIAHWSHKHAETLATLNPFRPEEHKDRIASLEMVSRSAALHEIGQKVDRYRESRQNVLILGETGTGKELVARALHSAESGSFFAINCAAYKGSAELLESELFGYERGAFTGAAQEKKGILEAANGGTVFLDEVHHLSLTAQAKLLRVIQDRKIRRVGGTKEYPVAFRLVAAAKPELEALCEKGEFLRDFYHRLNVLPLSLPALRDRPEDVEPLVAYFCRRYFEGTGQRKTFLLRTIRYLERYPWPGNVRELENTVYRLLTDCTAETVAPEQLDAKYFGPGQNSFTLTYDDLKKRHEKEEREHIISILKNSKSKLHAAQKLGLSASTLHSIMKRVGLYQAMDEMG